MAGDTEGVSNAYKKLKRLVTDLRSEGRSHLAGEVSQAALEGKKSAHAERDPERKRSKKTSRDPRSRQRRRRS